VGILSRSTLVGAILKAPAQRNCGDAVRRATANSENCPRRRAHTVVFALKAQRSATMQAGQSGLRALQT
jgi:hypothetical protein